MINISKYARWGLFLYLLALVTLSVMPLGGVSKELTDITVIRIRGDYLLHMLVYLPMISLMLLSFPKSKWGMVAIAIGLGVGLEYFQMFLSYRAFNINDLVANLAGVVVGGGIYPLISRITRIIFR
ncbi:VanZ family protein [bacterium]|nr:VanZ family protein [bacterium]